MIVTPFVHERKRNAARELEEFPKLQQLETIEGSNFVVVNLPEKIVAQLGAKSFKFIKGIDVEQEFVNILKVGRD